jgi:D-glucosaminate-6-phosphate ammonia-lyase
VNSIYQQWGVQPVINVSGSVTRLGGAPMPSSVLEAFVAAADESVVLEQLQAAASRYLAEVTGAEAGLVTSGSAAALLLGAAAILTGYDLARMEQLPHTEGFPHEFLVAREHRNGYDHAVRGAGVRFREVGFHEVVAGAGVRRVETWEYMAAVSPQTAGVFYVYGPDSQPDLAELVTAAHARGLPVLVDAAGEVPPRENLSGLIAAGADLVAISGGKGIRGPQATGILCGRRDLIGAAVLQMMDQDDYWDLWDPPAEWFQPGMLPGLPRHGIGRAMKVSKEQIIALLEALRQYLQGGYEPERRQAEGYLRQLVTELESHGIVCHLRQPKDNQSIPWLEIEVTPPEPGGSAADGAREVCRRLRRGSPPIHMGHGLLPAGRLVANPLHLNAERTRVLAERLVAELTRREPNPCP